MAKRLTQYEFKLQGPEQDVKIMDGEDEGAHTLRTRERTQERMRGWRSTSCSSAWGSLQPTPYRLSISVVAPHR